jgi:hypothetical protein
VRKQRVRVRVRVLCPFVLIDSFLSIIMIEIMHIQ